MKRALVLVLAVACGSIGMYAQQASVLHVKVLLLDAARQPTPVPHHALLISEDPPSTPPRRVVTTAEGIADVRLRPGNYIVESDRPVAFEGRVYQWTQRIAISAGRDSTLELNAANAAEATSPSGGSLETDPAFLLNRWGRSVVGLWTPLAHGAGFVVDAANGLVATYARLTGSMSDVEVQVTPEIKVRARIAAADPEKDVAILQVDPAVVASIPPLVPDCAAPASARLATGQEFVAIAVPLRGPKDLVTGEVVGGAAHSIEADLRLAPVAAGGPVFAAGRLAGLTSATGSDTDDSRARFVSRIVALDAVCAVLSSAAKAPPAAAPPDGTHLPVDPTRSFPAEALKAIVARRAGSLSPPQISSADFDVAFITPVHTYGAQSAPFTRTRQGAGVVDAGSPSLRPVRDFANWSDYVGDFLPVLLVRATPKLVEGFWATVARGAAQTQGVALPPIKRVKAGFARMRAFCGDQEVTPIHPFKIERRLSESEAIYEGLYAFDADALGPACATVKLTLYSDKQPDKADTRPVDPQIIQEIAKDFAAYRAATSQPAR
jgi:hypothetical protein